MPLLLLSRKKSRSAQRFACKRAHNALRLLRTFCGFAVLRHILWLKEKRKHHLEVSSNKTVCKNKLKAENQMLWVGKMNMCKAQTEEIVKLELIYD